MLDLKERNRLRKVIYGKPTIIVAAAVLLFVARGAWGMYQKNLEATEKRNITEEHLSELKQREAELSGDILNLSTDRGVEGEIRDRFMVAKDGENVMIVTDPDAQKVHTVIVSGEKPTIIQKMISAVGISN